MAETRQPLPENAADSWQKRLEGYREKILEKLLLGVPIALAAKLIDWATGTFTRQPWQAIWLLAPLAVAAWIAARSGRDRKDFQLNRPYLAFLSFYVLFFFTAAATNFLDWSRGLTVFEKRVTRNWLAPPAAGDWRYFLVRKKEPPPLAVVTMEPAGGRSLADVRYDIVRLITIASRAGAIGIAFDFYFEDKSDTDALVCSSIKAAGVPVLAGYSFLRVDGNIVPTTMPESLRSCIPEERQGHLAGFLDIDGVARFVPLFFGSERLPVLSLRVARILAAGSKSEIEMPASGLLRFVEPSRRLTEITYQNLFENPKVRGILKGRFVLVGEKSVEETFETPFGRKLGVTIHADAAHSLLQNCYIGETPWWLSIFFIAVVCYWLTLLAARGASAKRLVQFCLLVSMGIVALAAVMIVVGPWWLDIVYPIAAVWLLLPLVLGFRRVAVSRQSAA